MKPAVTTVARPTCPFCGSGGYILYRGLTDRLFGVEGEWTLRRCLSDLCRLIWLDPCPAQDELPKLYESYFTHSVPSTTSSTLYRIVESARWNYYFAKLRPCNLRSRRSWKLDVFSRLLPGLRAQWDASIYYLFNSPRGRLLEIGCGNGAILERLSKLGWMAEGIDFDPKAVEIARKRGLPIAQGSLSDCKFPDAEFDYIVMNHVIEHVPDPLALLQECRRILRSGGRLISITPNAAGWGHRRYGRHWLGLDAPRHLHIFEASSMRRLAHQAGFSHAEISTVAAHAHTFLWYSRQLQSEARISLTEELPLPQMMFSRLMQLRQLYRLKHHPFDGEELVLQVTKT